ncbi:hypothetical protein [Bacillus horti]|uniref:Uncharacterized protein n=1 Tax=Caldalkalibacillus horti TaxID=77523 RepID=A0ABT9W130_9BACI|nr:hypothetical protein [Bacillus horti]MDQ0166820.1 hypothetical protein [Bacillus horti]
MISEITLLERKRTRGLIGSLLGYMVWLLPVLANSLNDGRLWQLTGWGAVISGLGGLVWTFYLIRMVQLSLAVRKKRKLVNALNNEYYQLIRLKSFMVGFWVLIGVSTILLGLSQWIQLNIEFVLLTFLFTGVVTTLISYLIFEKE